MFECRTGSAALIARHIRYARNFPCAVDKDHGKPRRRRLVELRRRRLRVRADDDHPRDIARDEVPHALLLALRIVLRTGKQQRVGTLPQMLLHPVQHLGKEHIVEARYDDADARGTLGVQLTRLNVRHVFQLRNRAVHLLARLRAHGIAAVYHAGDRRHRDARLPRHIDNRRLHSIPPAVSPRESLIKL